uniref:Protein-tyrosine sulfotransferase n=1 Tax=Chaetoceros debilis TaxID=122233 RepID=A0A7S3PY43_9STRA|mmetsp:Transcript_18869/g.28695  ORF Transcript_18869/g.28695 Transcript_18869/m.28695 type:complete len:346 (+) Transcript_18869:101-1138(+)
MTPLNDCSVSTTRSSKSWRNTKSSMLYPEQITNFRLAYFFLACLIFLFLQTKTFHIIQKVWDPGYWSPYNQDNPNLQWCPYANCHNSPLCQPCERRFLIIIATGRSGSTTLTNMLDQLPNVRMAGENNGQLRIGFDAINNLNEPYEMNIESSEEVVGAWKHEPIAKQSLSCALQQMFELINPPAPEKMARKGFDDSETIIGFKTVRFHDELMFLEGEDDLIPAAKYLMESFPCARFVINIRGDVESQITSWYKNFGIELDGDEVRFYNKKLQEVASIMGQDRARLIDMVDWSQKDNSGLPVLNDLIEWLGFRDCKFESLLHSNKDGYKVDRTKMSLGQNCHYPSR